MLDINTYVDKGIIIINLEGVLNNNTFSKLNNTLNYLLYKQGCIYYLFNIKELLIDNSIINNFQNKLVEIFLNCGKVCLYGNNNIRKKLGNTKNNLFYLTHEEEAYNLLYL